MGVKVRASICKPWNRISIRGRKVKDLPRGCMTRECTFSTMADQRWHMDGPASPAICVVRIVDDHNMFDPGTGNATTTWIIHVPCVFCIALSWAG